MAFRIIIKMKIIKNKKHLIISGIVLLVILSLLYTAYNNKAEHYYFLGKTYKNQDILKMQRFLMKNRLG